MPDILQQASRFWADAGPVDILRAALLAGLAACTVLALFVGRRQPARSEAIRGRGLGAGIVCAFCAILVYQGTWQLAGFVRPRFLQFMRRYDQRANRAADSFRRGRILDRNGLLIAADDPERPGWRLYTMGKAGAHLVGYRHPRFGSAGLERAFEPLLSGRDFTTSDQLRRFYRNLLDHGQAAGSDLRLTIDARLQQVAQALLDGRAGACVVLDPRDGAVLTVVSSPSYDPSDLDMSDLRQRSDAPLFNRALHGLYPPGSAFKVVVAAAALDAGLDPVWDCPAAGFQPPGSPRPIRDHEYYEYDRRGRVWPGRADVDLGTALIRSSNVYFARLGVAVGVRGFERITKLCCFNQVVSLTSLPGGPTIKAGYAPTLEAGQERNLAQCSIGQGRLLVSPAQMAMVAAAIAEDGTMRRPRVVAGEPPIVMGHVMTPDTARRLRAVLRENVLRGTARRARIHGLEVAGKTGTAETPSGRDHAWFVGFAPADSPKVAFAMVMEHAGYASQTAVPAVGELLRAARRFGLFAEGQREGGP